MNAFIAKLLSTGLPQKLAQKLVVYLLEKAIKDDTNAVDAELVETVKKKYKYKAQVNYK